MNTAEALKALLEGKRITNTGYVKTKYLMLYLGKIVDNTGKERLLPISITWRLYGEPEQLKLYLYAFASGYGQLDWQISTEYYTDAQASRKYSAIKHKRLDNTMIEVDYAM